VSGIDPPEEQTVTDADKSERVDGWPTPIDQVLVADRPVWSPRALVSLLVTVPPLLLTIEAASRYSYLSMILPFLICAGITFTWLGFFFGALWTNGGRMPRRDLMRWLVIPAVLILTVLAVGSDLPFLARFTLSRAELDRVAADVMAGGPTDRTTIGLFSVEDVELTTSGMDFIIGGSGFFGGVRLAFSPNGPPTDTDELIDVEPIGAGWWTWSEAVD
jgi:hypothetical protein